MSERRSVSIDANIHDRITDRIEQSEFDNVDAYVDFVLAKLLDRLEGTSENDEPLGQDDEVKDRLRELGYLE